MDFTAESVRKLMPNAPLGADVVRREIEKRASMGLAAVSFEFHELSEGMITGLRMAGFKVDKLITLWHVSWGAE